jgi:hypothetical protein
MNIQGLVTNALKGAMKHLEKPVGERSAREVFELGGHLNLSSAAREAAEAAVTPAGDHVAATLESLNHAGYGALTEGVQQFFATAEPGVSEDVARSLRELLAKQPPKHEVLEAIGAATHDESLLIRADNVALDAVTNDLKRSRKLTPELRTQIVDYSRRFAEPQSVYQPFREVAAGKRTLASALGELQSIENATYHELAPGKTVDDLKALLTPEGYALRNGFSEVLGVGGEDASVALSGAIVDPAGEHVALISRELHDQAGDRYVYHSNFFIQPKFQGTGLANELYDKQFAAYREMGYTRVKTLANGQVGKYAWARQGFDYANPETLLEHRAALRTQLERAGADASQVALLDHLEHPWEVAAFKMFDGQGKEILLTPPGAAEYRATVTRQLKALQLDTKANLARLEDYLSGAESYLDLRYRNGKPFDGVTVPPELEKWAALIRGGVRQEPMSVGKYVMLEGQHWDGVLDLNPGSASWQRHQAYQEASR